MNWRSFLFRLRGSRFRDQVEEEMDEEMRFHLEMATQRNLGRGLSEREARRQAALQFGGAESFKEEARSEQRAMWFENFLSDVRFAFRMLRKRPAFFVAAVLTMALGIAANTAVFSVVNGILLRPLPLPRPEEISYLGWNWGRGRPIPALSGFQFEFLAVNSQSMQAVATYKSAELHVGREAQATPIRGLRVSEGFFDVLRIPPAQGREFDSREDTPGGPDVVILGNGVWKERFGADPALVGKTIQIDGVTHRVIGIMPPDYALPDLPEYDGFLLPLRLRVDSRDEGHNYTVIGRFKSGASSATREADIAALSRAFDEQYPDLAEPRESFQLFSYSDVFVGDLKATLWILWGAVTLVLLIACVNTAGLLLVRATSRQREIAVRTSLGAGRSRLLRQLLTEGIVLSLLASLVGLVLSQWGVRALLALAPGSIPRASEIGVDLRVLGYALIVTLATGLVFGLAAGFPALGCRLQSTLQQGSRELNPSGGRTRELLVLAETAVAVVLLTGASLLIVSFNKLISVDTGFDTESVVAVRLGRLPPDDHGAARKRLEASVLQELRSIPGVISAAGASSFPLERGVNFPVDTKEQPELGMGDAELRSVTPGYFKTLQIPLLLGRDFGLEDSENAPPVAIVNEAFARRFWPGQNPVGKSIQIGHYKERWLSPSLEHQTLVVGLASDVREMGLDLEPKPTVLIPRVQFYEWGPAILLRSNRTAGFFSQIRKAIRNVDPRLSPSAEPMSRLVSRSVGEPRFRLVLIGVFAASALFLAAVGIYGVIASTVQQRRKEIGLRMALGATRGRIAGAILLRCLKIVAGGLLVGTLAAMALSRFLAGMLYGTTITDPMALAMVVASLTLVGAVAGLLPALRASRLDPAGALRLD